MPPLLGVDAFGVFLFDVFEHHSLCGLRIGEGCHRTVVGEARGVFKLFFEVDECVVPIAKAYIHFFEHLVVFAQVTLEGFAGEVLLLQVEQEFLRLAVFVEIQQVLHIYAAEVEVRFVVAVREEVLLGYFVIGEATVGVAAVAGEIGEFDVSVGKVAVGVVFV